MLAIRLARIGKKKKPSFRIIVSEKSRDTQGDFLEMLGFYNPHTNPPTSQLKKERIKYWLSKGAQASTTVHNIFVEKKLIETAKLKKGGKKKKKKGGKEEIKGEQQSDTGLQKPDKKKEEKTKEPPKEAGEMSGEKQEATKEVKEDVKEKKEENKVD